ncbi:MAG TPA: DNA polymerase III subunit beta [bacterium]
MNITVERERLEKVLYYIQNIVEKKTTMPVLSHCLLSVDKKCIEVYATDLEISYSTSIDSSSDEKGKLVLPAKKFFEIIKEIPTKEIQIKTEDNFWVTVLSDKNISFRLAGLNPEDFPNIQRFNEASFSNISSEILNEMIDYTIYAVSTDETRYNLTGVLFEVTIIKNKSKIIMIATDGHRLSMSEKVIDDFDLKMTKGIILPRKGLIELKKMIEKSKEAGLAFVNNNFVTKVDGSILSMRLIEGEFPDYKGVIPKAFKRRAIFKKNDILSALKRASIMLSTGKFQGIKLTLDGKKMEVFANNPDIGSFKEDMDIEFEGEKIEIGFNSSYLLDALVSFKGEDIICELNDELNQAALKQKISSKDDNSVLAVVMPMRL